MAERSVRLLRFKTCTNVYGTHELTWTVFFIW